MQKCELQEPVEKSPWKNCPLPIAVSLAQLLVAEKQSLDSADEEGVLAGTITATLASLAMALQSYAKTCAPIAAKGHTLAQHTRGLRATSKICSASMSCHEYAIQMCYQMKAGGARAFMRLSSGE